MQALFCFHLHVTDIDNIKIEVKSKMLVYKIHDIMLLVAPCVTQIMQLYPS